MFYIFVGRRDRKQPRVWKRSGRRNGYGLKVKALESRNYKESILGTKQCGISGKHSRAGPLVSQAPRPPGQARVPQTPLLVFRTGTLWLFCDRAWNESSPWGMTVASSVCLRSLLLWSTLSLR